MKIYITWINGESAVYDINEGCEWRDGKLWIELKTGEEIFVPLHGVMCYSYNGDPMKLKSHIPDKHLVKILEQLPEFSAGVEQ